VPGELLLARHVEAARRRAHRDDHRVGQVLVAIVGLQAERRAAAEVHFRHRAVQLDARPEALGLRLHLLDELLPGQRLRKAGVVLDLVGQRDLPAQLVPGDDQRVEVGPRRVEGGGQPGGAGADDDHSLVLHAAGCIVLAAGGRVQGEAQAVAAHEFLAR